ESRVPPRQAPAGMQLQRGGHRSAPAPHGGAVAGPRRARAVRTRGQRLPVQGGPGEGLLRAGGAARGDGARRRPGRGDACPGARAIAHPAARVDCAAMRKLLLVAFLLGCATGQSATPMQPGQPANAAPARAAPAVPDTPAPAVLQAVSGPAKLQYPPTRRAEVADTLHGVRISDPY